MIQKSLKAMKNITHRLPIILRQKHQNKICTKKYRRAKDIFIVRDKVGKSRKKAHSMPTILLFAIKLEKRSPKHGNSFVIKLENNIHSFLLKERDIAYIYIYIINANHK